MNFIYSFDQHGVPMASLIYGWESANTQHTWQQNFRYPESQEVYVRLQSSVKKVTS